MSSQGNELAALRSHASEEVIGKTLCRLKPRPSEQLIVTLVGYHDNCHACRRRGCHTRPHVIEAASFKRWKKNKHASGKSNCGNLALSKTVSGNDFLFFKLLLSVYSYHTDTFEGLSETWAACVCVP